MTYNKFIDTKYEYHSVLGFWISRIKLILSLKSPFASFRGAYRTIIWNIILYIYCCEMGDTGKFGIWYGISFMFLFNAIHSAVCWYANQDFEKDRIRYKALFIMQIICFVYIANMLGS